MPEVIADTVEISQRGPFGLVFVVLAEALPEDGVPAHEIGTTGVCYHAGRCHDRRRRVIGCRVPEAHATRSHCERAGPAAREAAFHFFRHAGKRYFLPKRAPSGFLPCLSLPEHEPLQGNRLAPGFAPPPPPVVVLGGREEGCLIQRAEGRPESEFLVGNAQELVGAVGIHQRDRPFKEPDGMGSMRVGLADVGGPDAHFGKCLVAAFLVHRGIVIRHQTIQEHGRVADAHADTGLLPLIAGEKAVLRGGFAAVFPVLCLGRKIRRFRQPLQLAPGDGMAGVVRKAEERRRSEHGLRGTRAIIGDIGIGHLQ